jgi:hypothetical protein
MRAGIQELSVKGETIVPEGFYEIKFEGQAGVGLGVIVLRTRCEINASIDTRRGTELRGSQGISLK